jgi:predicted NBD/HSP70 family sugar kinase
MRKIDLTNFRLATSETARQINRRIALNFVRLHQPMSRADLARQSGLQRSTVSSIIDQLIEEGWVTEGAVGHAPRGRRPRHLHLNVERAGILGIDLRPEATTVGLAGVDARFVAQTRFATAADPDQFVNDLAAAAVQVRTAHPRMLCEGVGVCLPGRVDPSGMLVFAPNLGWGRVPIARMLEDAMQLPVNVDNAANACALAELWFGNHAARVHNIVAVTVSEGLGVGLLLNGQLVHGAASMAGEFGHVTIDENGPPCRCGRRGCWERYASNSAAVNRYLEATGRGSAQPGTPPMRFDELVRLAREGDSHANASLELMGRYLGMGLSNLVMGLAPDVIVIIGEVTGVWDLVGPVALATVKARTLSTTATRIIATDPATEPRLRGAVTLVVQQHFGAPLVA